MRWLEQAVGRALVLAVAGAGAACASNSAMTARPSPFPTSPRPAWSAEAPPNSDGAITAVLNTALALRGSRYQYGGGNPDIGFDCSGFVQYVLLQHRVAVPRTVAEQFRVGQDIDPKRVTPGDLIFFSTTAPGPTHVGIVVDSRTFVHAPDTGSVVRVERFDTKYWGSRVTGARRVPFGSSPSS